MRKTHTSEFKAKLVLEVLRGERTLSEIASENGVHPNMLTRWKTDALNNFHQLFENDSSNVNKHTKEYKTKIEELYTQIGELSAQNEWLKKIWSLIFVGTNAYLWLISTKGNFQFLYRQIS